MDIITKTLQKQFVRSGINNTIIILILIIFITSIEIVRTNHSLWDNNSIIKYLSIPPMLNTILPILVTINIISGLNKLGGFSRILALVSIGYQPNRFKSAAKTSNIIFVIIFLTLTEILCPSGIETMKRNWISQSHDTNGSTFDDVWLQRGTTLYHVRASTKPSQLEEYYAFSFHNRELSEITYSPQIFWINHQWKLTKPQHWNVTNNMQSATNSASNPLTPTLNHITSPKTTIEPQLEYATLPDSYHVIINYLLPPEQRSISSIIDELTIVDADKPKAQQLRLNIFGRIIMVWAALIISLVMARRVSRVSNNNELQSIYRRSISAAITLIIVIWLGLAQIPNIHNTITHNKWITQHLPHPITNYNQTKPHTAEKPTIFNINNHHKRNAITNQTTIPPSSFLSLGSEIFLYLTLLTIITCLCIIII